MFSHPLPSPTSVRFSACAMFALIQPSALYGYMRVASVNIGIHPDYFGPDAACAFHCLTVGVRVDED